tara:strand:+ start:903 stop:1337 length:435 start_codon:yes stop_codon:yes gene_type:complete
MSVLKNLYKVNKALNKKRYKDNPIRAGLTDIVSTGATVGGAAYLLNKKDEFDTEVQKELTRAYKLYENGEMTNEEFKYIEASFDELRNQKENLIKNNATFGVGLTTQEGIERGEPKYKLIVMQDKNPYTKDLPQGDTMGTGDFR